MGKSKKGLPAEESIPMLEKLVIGPISSPDELMKLVEIRKATLEVIAFMEAEIEEIDRAAEEFLSRWSCGECAACKARAAAAKEQNAPADAEKPYRDPTVEKDWQLQGYSGYVKAEEEEEFPDLLKALMDSLFKGGAKVVKLDPAQVAELFGKQD